MSKKRRSRQHYAEVRESRPIPSDLRRGDVFFRDSSYDLDDLDRLVAAPAVDPIRRFPDFESDPVPSFLAPDAVTWIDYPPSRTTPSQERRRAPRGPIPRGYTLAALLRPFYNVPEAAKVCVRRKERREVIFAKTGGGAGMPPRRRTPDSGRSC